jgi:hypothetical protein
MKYASLYYLAFVLVIIILLSLIFQTNYQEGLTTIDPSIVNSNIPNGRGLSNDVILSMLNELTNVASKTKITKINIVGNDTPIPAGTLNPGTLSINGRPVGTIGQNIKQLEGALSMYTSGVKSIDIQYSQT